VPVKGKEFRNVSMGKGGVHVGRGRAVCLGEKRSIPESDGKCLLLAQKPRIVPLSLEGGLKKKSLLLRGKCFHAFVGGKGRIPCYRKTHTSLSTKMSAEGEGGALTKGTGKKKRYRGGLDSCSGGKKGASSTPGGSIRKREDSSLIVLTRIEGGKKQNFTANPPASWKKGE